MEMFCSNVDAARQSKELQTPLVVSNQVQQLQFVSHLIVFHCNLFYSLFMVVDGFCVGSIFWRLTKALFFFSSDCEF